MMIPAIRANKDVANAKCGLSTIGLYAQAKAFESTGGTSKDNGKYGFLPAFLDTQTGVVYISRFADGRLAPLHVLDGLPEHLAIERNSFGHILAVKESVIAGFLKHSNFYTREAAAAITQNAKPMGVIHCNIIY